VVVRPGVTWVRFDPPRGCFWNICQAKPAQTTRTLLREGQQLALQLLHARRQVLHVRLEGVALPVFGRSVRWWVGVYGGI
jgi:hypothetical protein